MTIDKATYRIRANTRQELEGILDDGDAIVDIDIVEDEGRQVTVAVHGKAYEIPTWEATVRERERVDIEELDFDIGGGDRQTVPR